MKALPARLVIVCTVCILLLTSCWVPYFSPELSYGLVFSSKLQDPTFEYSANFISGGEALKAVYIPIPDSSAPTSGVLLVPDEGHYSVVRISLNVAEDTWDQASYSRKAIQIPEVPQLEYFAAAAGEQSGPAYLIRSTNHKFWTSDADGNIWAVAPDPFVHDQIKYPQAFIGASFIPGDTRQMLASVAVNWKLKKYASSNFEWDGGGAYDSWLGPSKFPNEGSGSFVGGSAILSTQFDLAISGLWGSEVRTYYKDFEAVSFKRASNIPDLLTSSLSNNLAYSSDGSTMKFYDVFADKKLFTLYTGNIRFVGEVEDQNGPRARFTQTDYEPTSGRLTVKIYDILLDDLEDYAD